MKAALRLLLAPYRFSVDRLFRMGEVGWAHWFDNPSLYPGGNHLYLYQDSAGTTPVTAVGDTIGLSLDRAYGGYRGPEGWSDGAVTFSGESSRVSPGVYRIYTSVGAYSAAAISGSMTIGKTYEATFTVDSVAAAGAGVTVEGATIGSWTTTGAKRVIFTAAGTSFGLKRAGAALTDIQVSNISLREIPGTHLIQATGTARPTLSARVNFLLATEDLSAANWTKGGSTITANAEMAPNGTATADKVIESATTAEHYVSHSAIQGFPADSIATFSFYVKAGERTKVGVQYPTTGNASVAWDLSTGTQLGAMQGSAISASISPVGAGWYLCKMTYSRPSLTTVANNIHILPDSATSIANRNYAGDGTSGLYVWGLDLRTADDAAKNIPAYQRVGATAADHDTEGFPHGQYPDGTDDNQTTTTGGGGTTGFFYCGAITVSGGAGTARTIWSDTGTNTGYRVRVNSSNKLELAAGNGSAYTTVQSNETITALGTYILSAWDDGGVLAVQVNNFAAATTTRPSVSAGTSTATMYKDNGAASSYLNGRDYGSVYRQSYIGESQHARLKRWLADRARITL